MIYHISIGVREPERVARILGEMLQGPVLQFVPGPGSYVVYPSGGKGTSLELLPEHLLHVPGKAANEGVNYVQGDARAAPSSAHLAIASPINGDALMAIAHREGWRALRCWRATAFELVEVWVENHFLIEFIPPEMQPRLADFMADPNNWISYFGLVEKDGIHRLPGSREDAYAAMAEKVRAVRGGGQELER